MTTHVADLMQGDLVTIAPDATVMDAVRLLADHHISALPVVNGHAKILGVVSTTDVLAAEAEKEDQAAREQFFSQTRVDEIMTPTPKTIAPTGEVHEAAQLMLYLEVHRLFVVDRDRLVGVISQTDVVRAVATATL